MKQRMIHWEGKSSFASQLHTNPDFPSLSIYRHKWDQIMGLQICQISHFHLSAAVCDCLCDRRDEQAIGTVPVSRSQAFLQPPPGPWGWVITIRAFVTLLNHEPSSLKRLSF